MACGGAVVAGVTGVCEPEGKGARGGCGQTPGSMGGWTEQTSPQGQQEAEGGMFKFAVWKDQIFSAVKIWVL